MNDITGNDDRFFDEPGDDSPETLAALYALGALSPADAARYETYLDSSPDVQALAAALTETADLLSSDVEPPASLKASIMAGILSLPQLPADDDVDGSPTAAPQQADDALLDVPAPESAPHVAPAAPAPTSKAAAAASSARLSKAQQKANSRWYSGPVSALAAAAAVVTVFLGASLITSGLNNGNGLPEALRLAYIDAQPDAARETIRLTNVTDEKQVTATLVWSGALGESVFVVDGLASLPEDKTYELWYIGADGPVSAGVFNTQRAGEGWRVLEGSMGAGDAVGVTVEPAGGSEQPTTDPLIVIPTT